MPTPASPTPAITKRGKAQQNSSASPETRLPTPMITKKQPTPKNQPEAVQLIAANWTESIAESTQQR